MQAGTRGNTGTRFPTRMRPRELASSRALLSPARMCMLFTQLLLRAHFGQLRRIQIVPMRRRRWRSFLGLHATPENRVSERHAVRAASQTSRVRAASHISRAAQAPWARKVTADDRPDPLLPRTRLTPLCRPDLSPGQLTVSTARRRGRSAPSPLASARSQTRRRAWAPAWYRTLPARPAATPLR